MNKYIIQKSTFMNVHSHVKVIVKSRTNSKIVLHPKGVSDTEQNLLTKTVVTCSTNQKFDSNQDKYTLPGTMMLRDKAGHGSSGRGTNKVSGSGDKGGSGGGKAGSGSGKGGSGADKGSNRRGVPGRFELSATMSPMLPTTRSCASNAVATSALHGGGKGGSGSGKGGSSGGTGGSVRIKGKSGRGTELFATSAAMSPTPPPQPGKLLLLPQKLTKNCAVVAVLLVEARIVTRMIGGVPGRVIGSSQLMMVESAAPTRDYRGSRIPQEHVGIKDHAPRCLMLKMMMRRLILLMVTRSQNLGSSFICTLLLERTYSSGRNLRTLTSTFLSVICQHPSTKEWRKGWNW
jgi:hypothetical protein